MIVAIAVVLGFTAVVSRVQYFWYGIVGVHVVICLLVSCQLDSIHGGYTWTLGNYNINSAGNVQKFK